MDNITLDFGNLRPLSEQEMLETEGGFAPLIWIAAVGIAALASSCNSTTTKVEVKCDCKCDCGSDSTKGV